jgi:hypothetical protein
MQLKAKVDEVRQCTAKNAEKARCAFARSMSAAVCCYHQERVTGAGARNAALSLSCCVLALCMACVSAAGVHAYSCMFNRIRPTRRVCVGVRDSWLKTVLHGLLVLCRQLRKLKREQEQREFEALQEQGLNPYEIYRVRDAEAAAVQAAAQQAARQKQRKAEIAAALAAEDRAHRKQVAKQEFDRQVRHHAWGSAQQTCHPSTMAANPQLGSQQHIAWQKHSYVSHAQWLYPVCQLTRICKGLCSCADWTTIPTSCNLCCPPPLGGGRLSAADGHHCSAAAHRCLHAQPHADASSRAQPHQPSPCVPLRGSASEACGLWAGQGQP